MLAGIRGVRLTVLRVEAKFKYDDPIPSTTANASSTTSRSATTGSTPEPPPSNGGASPRSVTGGPTEAVMTTTAPPAPSRCRPGALAMVAMLSVQLGSALSVDLISAVGPAGNGLAAGSAREH